VGSILQGAFEAAVRQSVQVAPSAAKTQLSGQILAAGSALFA
jgi:hypothetical protein